MPSKSSGLKVIKSELIMTPPDVNPAISRDFMALQQFQAASKAQSDQDELGRAPTRLHSPTVGRSSDLADPVEEEPTDTHDAKTGSVNSPPPDDLELELETQKATKDLASGRLATGFRANTLTPKPPPPPEDELPPLPPSLVHSTATAPEFRSSKALDTEVARSMAQTDAQELVKSGKAKLKLKRLVPHSDRTVRERK
ncbi:unnamed protein product [Rhizoctonia solani]|uniref:Uncharacterized protein n=1 Tax=Rhizoctonia solani TaxID=456999 RepID=A0A8H3H6V1_9AGAM|nr:unnamed protein product [Rhizoctonia solani]